MIRRILCAAALSVAARSAVEAQQRDTDDAKTQILRRTGEVGAFLLKAAEMVPADKYSYRPTASVRTFGQLIGHVADGQNFFCAQAAGRSVEWVETVEKGPQDKATLMQKLKQSNDLCTAAAASGRAAMLVDNLGHSNLHYGNVITYMRMLGLTPPSS